MKKLLTLTNDGRLALRGNGSETVIPERRAPNVLLLIDVSQSMTFIDWVGTNGQYVHDPTGEGEACAIGQARKGGAAFAREASAKGYATALGIFADRPAMVCDPTTDSELLGRKIAKLRPGMLGGNNTDLAAALNLAAKFKDLAAVVIVTDGIVDENATIAAAYPLKRREVEIICIGTGAANKAFLGKLATTANLATHVKPEDLSAAITDASRLLTLGHA